MNQICLVKGRKSRYTQENGEIDALLSALLEFIPQDQHGRR